MEEAIIISWPNDFDDKQAEEIIGLSVNGIIIKGVQTESEMWAAFEWTIPTTFTVTITALFFKVLAEEAVKDVYQLIKSKISEYLIERRKIKTSLIVSERSPDKLSKNYDQSLTVSLKARLHTALLITVLISEKVSDEESQHMLDGMLRVLELLYQDCQQKAPEDDINYNSRPNEVYLVANLETRQWDILTSKQMSERYKNPQ